ncbi:MAG: hypothetical protein SGPRY_002232, partial [Prymnesium sp.]
MYLPFHYFSLNGPSSSSESSSKGRPVRPIPPKPGGDTTGGESGAHHVVLRTILRRDGDALQRLYSPWLELLRAARVSALVPSGGAPVYDRARAASKQTIHELMVYSHYMCDHAPIFLKNPTPKPTPPTLLLADGSLTVEYTAPHPGSLHLQLVLGEGLLEASLHVRVFDAAAWRFYQLGIPDLAEPHAPIPDGPLLVYHYNSSLTSREMIIRSPPLRHVSLFLEEEPSPVACKLSQPLWNSSGPLRMLIHTVQLQTLLEAQDSAEPRSFEEICSASPGIQELVDEICNDSEILHAGSSPTALILRSGLAGMCPLVGHHMIDSEKVYTDASISTLQKYLDQITGIHQVLTSALHLQEDVKTHNFKYTAHKLALLYHAVNSSRTQQDVLRKRIEEHFED